MKNRSDIRPRRINSSPYIRCRTRRRGRIELEPLQSVKTLEVQRVKRANPSFDAARFLELFIYLPWPAQTIMGSRKPRGATRALIRDRITQLSSVVFDFTFQRSLVFLVCLLSDEGSGNSLALPRSRASIVNKRSYRVKVEYDGN